MKVETLQKGHTGGEHEEFINSTICHVSMNRYQPLQAQKGKSVVMLVYFLFFKNNNKKKTKQKKTRFGLVMVCCGGAAFAFANCQFASSSSRKK